MLKPRTVSLLRELHSRREIKSVPGFRPDGYRRFTRCRVRTLKDYQRLVRFARCPKSVRDFAQSWIDNIVAESRQCAARYGDDIRW